MFKLLDWEPFLVFCIEHFGRARNFSFQCSKFADVIEVILEIQ